MKDNPDPNALTFGFFREIGILAQLSQALLAQVLPEGVHPSHFSILNHLEVRGTAQPPAQIASAMQVTKTTMTHSLRVLQSHGFIDIGANPEDARGKLVALSEPGRVFVLRAREDVTARFADLFGPEQIGLMTRTFKDLQSLRAHLDENR